MKADTLPFEVLNQVFSKLDMNELRDCLPVCQRWKKVAADTLRKTIRLGEFTEKTAAGFIRNLARSPEMASQVRCLDLEALWQDEPEPEGNTKDFVRAVLTHCVDLVEILPTLVPDPVFWETLSQALEDGYLQRLRTIPGTLGPSTLQYYVPIANRLKSRIRHINLRMPHNSDKQLCPFSASSWLANFAQLETFTLVWDGEMSLMDCDTMINGCCASHNFHSLVLYIQGMDNDPSVSLDFLRSVTPRPSIQHLRLRWGSVHIETLVLLLLVKFTQLESLNFGTGIEAGALSNDVAQAFFSYLSNIPSVNISSDILTSTVGNCLDNLLNTESQAHLSVIFIPAFGEVSSMFIQKQADSASNMVFCVPINSEHLYPLEWLDRIGSKLNTLSIDSFYRLQERVITNDTALQRSIMGNWLNVVFEKATLLTTLNIMRPGVVVLNGNGVRNLSIQRLKLQDLSFADNQDPLFENLSTLLPSLKYLSIHDLRVRNQPYVAFSLMQWHIRHSDISDSIYSDIPKAIFEVNMALTSLKELTWHIHCPDLGKHLQSTRLFVKVETQKDTSHFDVSLESIVSLQESAYEKLLETTFIEIPVAVLVLRFKSLANFRLVLNDSEKVYHLDV